MSGNKINEKINKIPQRLGKTEWNGTKPQIREMRGNVSQKER
jgi:hypothetical protein